MLDNKIDPEVAEQLSALVDGELGRDERAFLLKRLAHDEAARARLGRYYLVRDALQRNLPDQRIDGIADGVRRALAAEAPHRKRLSPGWARPAMGGALAAAVAAVTVTWWQGQAPVTPEGAVEPMASVPAGIPESVIDFPSLERFTHGARDSLLPASTGGTVRSAPAVQEFVVPEVAAPTWDTVEMETLSPQLRQLLVDHAEHAASGGLGGMLDYIRFAGHGEGE